MTISPDAAREAVARALWDREFSDLMWDAEEEAEYLLQADAAIDAYLTTALEGADGRIAEDLEYQLAVALDEARFDADDYVTVNRAKLKSIIAAIVMPRVSALSAKLKAQKASHAKMLKAVKEFLECWDWTEEVNNGASPPITAEHIAHGQKIVPEAVEELRRLADKIEGGV